MKHTFFLLSIVVLSFSMVNPNSSYGDTFYSPYGRSKSYNLTVAPGNHYFEINRIGIRRRTQWYVDGTLRETDNSGVLAIDPAITVNLPEGTHRVTGVVYIISGAFLIWEETHTWKIGSGALRADLQVTSIEINDSTASDQHFLPGETVRLDFLGFNGGTAPAFGSSSGIGMRWWYGASAYAKTYHIDIGYVGGSNGLNPGESEWRTDESWQVPSTPGTYWLTVKIDDSNAISPESDETNNERTLQFSVVPGLKEALDTPDLEWTDGGIRPWLYQTNVSHDGTDAAQSGRIRDGQSSSLETSVVGPGTLSFWWKVSSEPRDRLSLYVNDSLQTRISGIKSWRSVELSLPDGVHALRWTYRKNRTLKGGQDRAWLDQVSFIAASPTTPTAIPLNISVAHGQIILAWPVEGSKNYQVLYTDSLSEPQWQILDVAPSVVDGFATASDPVRNQSQRFYRVIHREVD